jgi:hypothetical protein
VILERANGPDLNPGTAPFHYGASVLVRRDETAAGSNVVQKGYANRGGEWKLQVDGAGGYPSCVLVGRGSGRLHTVRSSRSVADGQWHQVTCWRSATAFAIAVDGVDRGRVGLPAGLDITNTMPLRIGGKHARAGNDQYAGAVDDVFFARD